MLDGEFDDISSEDEKEVDCNIPPDDDGEIDETVQAPNISDEEAQDCQIFIE